MKPFSSDSAGKRGSSPQSVTGVCSAQPGPAWTLPTAGVSSYTFSTYFIPSLVVVVLVIFCITGSIYTNISQDKIHVIGPKGTFFLGDSAPHSLKQYQKQNLVYCQLACFSA